MGSLVKPEVSNRTSKVGEMADYRDKKGKGKKKLQGRCFAQPVVIPAKAGIQCWRALGVAE